MPTLNVEYSRDSENEVLSQDSLTGNMISATTTGTTRSAPSTSRQNEAKQKCATGKNYVKKKKNTKSKYLNGSHFKNFVFKLQAGGN